MLGARSLFRLDAAPGTLSPRMTNETETLSAGQVIAGRYRVERCLGQGGMGSVYLVHHLHTEQAFALKMLHPDVVADAQAVERFRREAQAPARIGSDHVVRVSDADTAPELDGAPFLVMEYLRGRDLEYEVTARGKLPPGEVLLYLSQTAKALDKAHAMGIVHRDLKPENLFLTERDDGAVAIKVLDFGIAKVMENAPGGAATKTATGAVFGTPLYMAPEQAKGENKKVCGQTDVFALGLIAHKLLSGKDMWTPNSMAHLVALVAFEPLPPPSSRGGGLGPAFDKWFAKCCDHDIAKRFATAGEAVAELTKVLGEKPANPRSIKLDPVVALAAPLAQTLAAPTQPAPPQPSRPSFPSNPGDDALPRPGDVKGPPKAPPALDSKTGAGAATQHWDAKTLPYRSVVKQKEAQKRGNALIGVAVGLMIGLGAIALLAMREGSNKPSPQAPIPSADASASAAPAGSVAP